MLLLPSSCPLNRLYFLIHNGKQNRHLPEEEPGTQRRREAALCPGPSHALARSLAHSLRVWEAQLPSSKMGMFAQETLKTQNATREGGRDVGRGLTNEGQVSGPVGPPRKRMRMRTAPARLQSIPGWAKGDPGARSRARGGERLMSDPRLEPRAPRLRRPPPCPSFPVPRSSRESGARGASAALWRPERAAPTSAPTLPPGNRSALADGKGASAGGWFSVRWREGGYARACARGLALLSACDQAAAMTGLLLLLSG